MSQTNFPLQCNNCGNEGKEEEFDIDKTPSPDGHYARYYYCPECHSSDLEYQ